MKLLINCKLLSVGNRIKTSGSSGWCEYFNVPMCQPVGFVTHRYASLARRDRSKTVAKPKINPSCVRHSKRRRLISNLGACPIGCEVLTRFPRASGASEQRSQFPSYTYTLYCLAYISWYYLILSAISNITLHCTKWK